LVNAYSTPQYSGLYQSKVLHKQQNTFAIGPKNVNETFQVKLGKRRDSKEREKFERRILDELQRIFTETDSFYYCSDGDLTNSLQRQCDLKEKSKELLNNKGVWRTVDDRFFWNKHMLQDLISLNVSIVYRCIGLISVIFRELIILY
jgi:hypothetical protein